MEKRKLLSVVVPTKDRYYYLKHLIELIAGVKSDEVEMVIQDNSDDNSEFVDYLNGLNYDFIRYSHIAGQIPMSVNSDKAVLNSTGEYICFLGDDDGVTKFLVDGVRWMKNEGLEAVRPAEIIYSWPGAPQGTSAEMSFYPFTGEVKFLSAYDELLKILKAGIPNRGRMPLAYHSVVSRAVMDKVYETAGTYFPGNSPDISNAVALSLVVKKFATIDMPWAYSGNSPYKGGGVFARGNATPKITEIPWFRPNPEERWSSLVPRIASGSNIWADSTIESLKNMHREDLIKQINFDELYANFIFSLPNQAELAYSICGNRAHLKRYVFYNRIKRYSKAALRRIGWKLGVIPKKQIVRNLNTIAEASRKLEDISRDLGYRFDI